jgi:hypothetical protein
MLLVGVTFVLTRLAGSSALLVAAIWTVFFYMLCHTTQSCAVLQLEVLQLAIRTGFLMGVTLFLERRFRKE